MTNSRQSRDESVEEDLDIDDNVGLTHDELSEIVDNIDFKEIDNLEEITELSEEEVESVDFDSTQENQEIVKEEIESAELTPSKTTEEKEEEDDFSLALSDENIEEGQEIKELNIEDNTISEQVAVALSEEELTKLEKNIDNINSNFNEKDEEIGVNENGKKSISTTKKKNKTKAGKSPKKNSILQINSKEVKELLLFLDKQLAFIPQKKIEEFVKSKHYSTYLKLISTIKQ